MKFCIYISILACCLSVSLPAFAQSPSNCEPQNTEAGPVQVCTFATGANSSVIATFDCPSLQTPCPDPGAHSIKFTVGTVTAPFTIDIVANKVTGDGICDTGIPGADLSDPVDCRFVRFFGDPAYNNEPPVGPPNSNTKVPFCYPYAQTMPGPLGQPRCVVYQVTDEFGGPTPKPGP